MVLPDGSSLMRHDAFDAHVRTGALVPAPGRPHEGTLAADSRTVLRVHPAFRVLALSEGAALGPNTPSVPCTETLGLFAYHAVPALTPDQQRAVVTAAFPAIDPACVDALLRLNHHISATAAPGGGGGSGGGAAGALAPLSTRQLLRMARR
jgi:hypothetical protein